MKRTLKRILVGTFLASALLGSGCDRQNKLESKWDYALSRGSNPYTVQVNEIDINEYLDTNLNGMYDLIRISDKKLYSEIPEPAQEYLGR